MNKEFAQRVKNLRIKKGYTQEVLGAMVGISAKAISRYENGLALPTYNALISLALALECTTDYLVGLSINTKSSDINDFKAFCENTLTRNKLNPNEHYCFIHYDSKKGKKKFSIAMEFGSIVNGKKVRCDIPKILTFEEAIEIVDEVDYVLNSYNDFLIFRGIGGNALIKLSILQNHYTSLLAPKYCYIN